MSTDTVFFVGHPDLVVNGVSPAGAGRLLPNPNPHLYSTVLLSAGTHGKVFEPQTKC